MEPLPTVQRLLPTLIFFFSMENANEGGKLWQATTTKMQDTAQSREKRAQILGQFISESFEKTEEKYKDDIILIAFFRIMQCYLSMKALKYIF